MDTHLLRNRLRFVGKGADLFGIYIVNLLLSIVTLGFYYPWARAAVLRYTYANTWLDNQPFQFHGTGKELFTGFIKAVGAFIALYAILISLAYIPSLALRLTGYFLTYALLVALIPLIIHGALRYRLSRTSWQGIHFGYRGNRNELLKLYLTEVLLVVITFGIYSFWMSQHIRRYTIGHIRFGSAEMRYTGDGTDYFRLNVKGYFLTLITAGIYSFWWGRDLFDYYIDNLAIEHEGQTYQLQSSLSVGDYFDLVIINTLIIIFTLGLGSAWVTSRTLTRVFDNILLDERLDTSGIIQTEPEYRDATGEDMADMLDIGLV